MSNHEEPKIHFRMPHVEGLEYAVALVRATGARGEGDLREFVIKGPTMTISEVAAFLRLVTATAMWDDGETFEFTVEPEPEAPVGGSTKWWEEQWGGPPGKYQRRRPR